MIMEECVFTFRPLILGVLEHCRTARLLFLINISLPGSKSLCLSVTLLPVNQYQTILVVNKNIWGFDIHMVRPTHVVCMLNICTHQLFLISSGIFVAELYAASSRFPKSPFGKKGYKLPHTIGIVLLPSLMTTRVGGGSIIFGWGGKVVRRLLLRCHTLIVSLARTPSLPSKSERKV
jgi:hypothetical protein